MYIATYRDGKPRTIKFNTIKFSSQETLMRKFEKMANTMLKSGEYDSIALYDDNPIENNSAIMISQVLWKNDKHEVL
jgi:hypothetical protein